MAIFSCSACGEPLTGELEQMTGILGTDERGWLERDPITRRAPPTVPPGYFAIDPEPWGAPYIVREDPDEIGPVQSRSGSWATDEGEMQSAGPRNTVVLNPDDITGLTVITETSSGCCGPTGYDGPNRACRCGSPVATLAADCFSAYEVHLNPSVILTTFLGQRVQTFDTGIRYADVPTSLASLLDDLSK